MSSFCDRSEASFAGRAALMDPVRAQPSHGYLASGSKAVLIAVYPQTCDFSNSKS